jgi:hypothetical protein
MKKLFTITLLCILLAAVMISPAQALTIEKDIYPGAFDHKSYPGPDDRLRDISPNDPSDYPYDQIIYGKVTEKGTYTDIDRVYMDYPEDMSESHTEELEYPFVDPDGETQKFVGRATFTARNEIRVQAEAWDHYAERHLDTHVLTTLHGQPALVKETGSKVFGENASPGENATYRYEAIVLVDDKNVSGCVTLKYTAGLSYKIVGWGMGFGWEDNAAGFEAAQQEWWSNTLLPKLEEYKEKASDVTVKIKRVRLYNGKIGAGDTGSGEEEEKPDEKEYISVVENTRADRDRGETSIPIPEAVAIAIIGAGAAIAGAGAGGGSSDSGNGGMRKSRYKMYLYKEFGDAIRYDTQPVTVYARIAELTPEGEEVDRPDLTGSIEIFSGRGMTVEGCTMAGNYMGALISAQSVPGGQNPDSGVVIIKYTGEGGSFQNNVAFRLIGEPYIEYYGQGGTNQLPVLGASGRTFTMDCEARDFIENPQLEVKGSYTGFSVELEPQGENRYRISVTDRAERPENLDRLRIGIDVEITAKAGEETYSSAFTVIQCFEGLTADYWGKPREIRAYADEYGEMVKTVIGFSLGVWNEPEGVLDITAPRDIEINFKDDKEINKLIGVEYVRDEISTLEHVANFIFTAQKPYPATQPAGGVLSAISGEYAYQSEIDLIPDIQQYTEDYEKEYAACKRIIETYMAPRFRNKKLGELELNRHVLGLEDFRIFRRNCWKVAEISILQEKQEYVADEAWYDEAIATADLIVYIGDIAFDLALAPIGGPITGFLAGQVKSGLLEFISLYVEGPDKSISELAWDFAINRLNQTAGSGDGLIEMPNANEPKKLAVWLSCYVIYRIAYHWQFDKDDSNNPIGVTEAIKRGLLDFVGKGAGVLLGDFIQKSAKGRWPEKISIAKPDQDLTNKAVSGAAKTVFNAGDKLADKADAVVMDTTAYVAKVLNGYLDALKIGV